MAKILVADDSQTIQKVVAITLANEPFELVQAENEEQTTFEFYDLLQINTSFFPRDLPLDSALRNTRATAALYYLQKLMS